MSGPCDASGSPSTSLGGGVEYDHERNARSYRTDGGAEGGADGGGGGGTLGMTTGASLGVLLNAAGVDGAGMRAVVESGAWNMGRSCETPGDATCGALGGALGAACTRIEAKLITASGFIGSRDERGALGGGGGMVWTTSLAIGAIGGSGGGAERGATDAVGIDELAPTGGGMLGAETRGATGAGAVEAPRGTFGAIGAFGAMGDFGLCGRKSDGATRTAGSAASALPDGVFLDLAPASFAIRKF